MGISTNRYLPAIGTAGFDRDAVRGESRLPCPPPNTMQITFDVITVYGVVVVVGIKLL